MNLHRRRSQPAHDGTASGHACFRGRYTRRALDKLVKYMSNLWGQLLGNIIQSIANDSSSVRRRIIWLLRICQRPQRAINEARREADCRNRARKEATAVAILSAVSRPDTKPVSNGSHPDLCRCRECINSALRVQNYARAVAEKASAEALRRPGPHPQVHQDWIVEHARPVVPLDLTAERARERSRAVNFAAQIERWEVFGDEIEHVHSGTPAQQEAANSWLAGTRLGSSGRTLRDEWLHYLAILDESDRQKKEVSPALRALLEDRFNFRPMMVSAIGGGPVRERPTRVQFQREQWRCMEDSGVRVPIAPSLYGSSWRAWPTTIESIIRRGPEPSRPVRQFVLPPMKPEIVAAQSAETDIRASLSNLYKQGLITRMARNKKYTDYLRTIMDESPDEGWVSSD
jgi:hypothetical protein